MFRYPLRDGRRREHLRKQTRQLAPLRVGAAATDFERQRLQPLQRRDLALELGDGARRGCLIENLLLGGLDFVVWGVLEIFERLGVDLRDVGRDRLRYFATAPKKLQLAQPSFEPLAAAAQRLEDRLG